MLLFGFLVSKPLKNVARAAPGIAVAAIADDITLVGRVPALRAAFQALKSECGGHGRALRLADRKCALTGGPRDAVAALARELRVQHKPEGIVLCGAPIGTDDFARDTIKQRADSVEALTVKLVDLPLGAQCKWKVLSCSLALRMTHLQRNTDWALLAPGIRRAEDAVLRAAANIFKLPLSELPNRGQLPNSADRSLLTLPVRWAGFGLRVASRTEADAAYLTAAAVTQAAVAAGPEAFQPFSGATRAPLAVKWRRVFDDVAEPCGWDPIMRDLGDPVVTGVLPTAQRVVARAIADRRGTAVLAACDLNTPRGKHDAARLRSSAGGAASAWLTAMPVAQPTTIGNFDFVMAGRHRLGYGIHSDVALKPCLCRAGSAGSPDHAMVCESCAQPRTIRHDTYAEAWRRVTRMAGLASSREPRYGALVGSAARAAAAGLHRGDILVIMENQMRALDVVVTHPGAATYVAAAARTTGARARSAEQDKVSSWLRVGRDSGYEFTPLAVETYGRMGVQAARLLSDVADIAAQNGVSKAAFVRMAHTELSCALVKGMGRVYSRGMNATVRAAGRAFQEGCPVAVADTVSE
jgi:hypothetical protein